MKQTIAVVYGGYSAEWEISVKSGKNVAKNIDRTKYTVYEVLLTKERWSVEEEGKSYLIDRGDFSFVKEGVKIYFDKIFIIIHGDPGENGLLQAYFEMINIPTVGCSSLVTTIAFDKYACKTYLRDSGVRMAKDLFIRRGESYSKEGIIEKLGLPIFVKPTNGGSSFGVTKVKKYEELDKAIEVAFSDCETVILEEAISGRELDCGVYSDKNGVHPLPVIEIISKNEFFDYEAKYLGASDEVCPAEISKSLSDTIQKVAVDIFKYLGCKGLVRMDFIARGEEVFFLELNPNPGMTAESLVPKEVKVAGIDMVDFLTSLIDNK